MTVLAARNRRIAALLRRLLREESGLALTEFALIAPIFLTLGLLGTETANYIIVHMRVSQVAMHVADNASRVGEHNVLVSRKVYEDDINDLFLGAERYADGLDLASNGRIILSSLEVNDDDGQWIHWQRCFGDKDFSSSYGDEGDGEEGTDFPGMGSEGSEIMAVDGEAVMFVEVSYTYQPLSPFSGFSDSEIRYTAAYNVRDSRDLTELYQTTPESEVASCSE